MLILFFFMADTLARMRSTRWIVLLHINYCLLTFFALHGLADTGKELTVAWPSAILAKEERSYP